jgi:hypothetical protein
VALLNHATASLFPGSRPRMQLAAPIEGQCARLRVPSCLAQCTSREGVEGPVFDVSSRIR